MRLTKFDQKRFALLAVPKSVARSLPAERAIIAETPNPILT
jgi:hypothetical protein